MKKVLHSTENSFIAANSSEISNISQLADQLEKMDEQTYTHHANESKNDFSTWAQEVLNDEKLAGDLNQATTKDQAQIAALKRIIDHVNHLSK